MVVGRAASARVNNRLLIEIGRCLDYRRQQRIPEPEQVAFIGNKAFMGVECLFGPRFSRTRGRKSAVLLQLLSTLTIFERVVVERFAIELRHHGNRHTVGIHGLARNPVGRQSVSGSQNRLGYLRPPRVVIEREPALLAVFIPRLQLPG